MACGFNVSGTAGSFVPLVSDGFCLLVCDAILPSERLSLMHCAACAVIGFVLCTIPKIHYQVLLVATAIVGSTAVILGVDCFTTAGLKEVRLFISSIRIMQMLNFLSSSICGISDTGTFSPSILVTTFSFPSHSLWRLRSVSSELSGLWASLSSSAFCRSCNGNSGR